MAKLYDGKTWICKPEECFSRHEIRGCLTPIAFRNEAGAWESYNRDADGVVYCGYCGVITSRNGLEEEAMKSDLCSTCGGSGNLTRSEMEQGGPISFAVECQACNGTGEVILAPKISLRKAIVICFDLRKLSRTPDDYDKGWDQACERVADKFSALREEALKDAETCDSRGPGGAICCYERGHNGTHCVTWT